MEKNPRDVRMAMAVPVENAPESEIYELPEDFVSWNKQTFEHLIEKPVSYTHLTLPTS